MKKQRRILAFILALCLMVPLFALPAAAANTSGRKTAERNAEEEAACVENLAKIKKKVYNTKIKPHMDKIGDNLRRSHSSQEDLRKDFKTAKKAIKALKKACKNLPALSKDKTLMNYIRIMEDTIKNGAKASTQDEAETCLKETLKTLKKFRSRIKKHL